jgi:hypothetical protein
MPTGPFVADVRSFDIPNTMCACVRNADHNCVAISFRLPQWPIKPDKTVAAVERVARRKGIRIIWVPLRAALREQCHG